MEKLKQASADVAEENRAYILQRFPNCATEVKDEWGNITTAIDMDVLAQELCTQVVEGRKERYVMTWPGKREALHTANEPSTMALRPCREESKDFEHTQNLYIEGDNLEVLKALRETYLGEVKMVYIDPPYNTGNDFVYNDDFALSMEEYRGVSGDFMGGGKGCI